MHSEGDQVHVSEEEASGGSKEGVVRWVLVIGLILAIGALSIIWIAGAAFRTDPDADNANVSAKIAAEKEQAGASDTDSIVAPPASPAAEASERKVENGQPVVEN